MFRRTSVNIGYRGVATSDLSPAYPAVRRTVFPSTLVDRLWPLVAHRRMWRLGILYRTPGRSDVHGQLRRTFWILVVRLNYTRISNTTYKGNHERCVMNTSRRYKVLAVPMALSATTSARCHALGTFPWRTMAIGTLRPRRCSATRLLGGGSWWTGSASPSDTVHWTRGESTRGNRRAVQLYVISICHMQISGEVKCAGQLRYPARWTDANQGHRLMYS
ncbi:hypothetical protein C8Q77DRAFT_72889 [Trametes polyzona]|nr:hypothetical protein C8Q77DRAFT_72889 [Trametes polyzona]